MRRAGRVLILGLTAMATLTVAAVSLLLAVGFPPWYLTALVIVEYLYLGYIVLYRARGLTYYLRAVNAKGYEDLK